MNLVVNARDAMPNGGNIVITAAEVAPEGDGETLVELSVRDTGEGMDADTQARAMDRSLQRRRSARHRSGLSMVRGMVEQCGGRFCSIASLARGTTARILLKIAEQKHSEEPRKTSCDRAIEHTSLRILAVDDDGIILPQYSNDPGRDGLSGFEASSGAATLEILENEEIDLMITDYAMPSNMTGAELAERARDRDPDLKIIIASGFAELPEGGLKNYLALSSRTPRMNLQLR